MKSRDYLNRRIDCPCGLTHVSPLRELVYADDCLDRLPALGRAALDGREATVAILFDDRTEAVGGEETARNFAEAGWTCRAVRVPDPAPDREPVCDDHTRDALLPAVADCGLIVSVGGGVLSDLGKYLAIELDAPQLTVATALSMNGYTSANIAPAVGGVKTLVPGRTPHAVLASPSVLAAAPWRLTSAGLGDALAKSVSTADWKLNELLFGDAFCPEIAGLLAEIEPLYLQAPADLRAGQPVAIAGLFDALQLTGIAMTLVGTSSPASGAEHLLSHCLDMFAQARDGEHDLHGRQVGVGTVLAAEVYRRVLAVESPELREPKTDVDEKFWAELTPAVRPHFQQKLPRLQAAAEALAEPGRWDAIRQELARIVRPPEFIAGVLDEAGGARKAEDIGTSRARLIEILPHADELRSRFTVLDLAHLLGILPETVEEVVEPWA